MARKYIELYEFKDLDEKAKQEALRVVRERNDEFGYQHEINEAMQEVLAWAGIKDAELSYSLGYSQGDGASFTVKNLDLRHLVRAQRAQLLAVTRKQWLEQYTIGPSDEVIGDLAVGRRVITTLASVKDADGNTVRTAAGGYEYHTVYRCNDDKGGEILSVETGVGTHLLVAYGDATEDTVEVWRRLLLDTKDIGSLLDDDADIQVNVVRSDYHYVHANTVRVEIEGSIQGNKYQELADELVRLEAQDADPQLIDQAVARCDEQEAKQDQMLVELRKKLDYWVKGVCRELERAGYAVIEERRSDETLQDQIESEGMLFTRYGRRVVDVDDLVDLNDTDKGS